MSQPAEAAASDLDADGDNDFDDFRTFQKQFIALNGQNAFAMLSRSIVPEPASWSLALSAVGSAIRFKSAIFPSTTSFAC